MSNIKTVSLTAPSDFDVDRKAIDRRRKLAEVMQAQAMQQDSGTQMVGGYAIPKSPMEGIGKMAMMWASAMGAKNADQEERGIAEQARSRRAQDFAEAMRARDGTQEQVIQPDPQEAQQSADYGTPEVGPVTNPAVPGSRQAMYARLLQSQDPGLQQLGMGGMLKEDDKPVVVGRSLLNPRTGEQIGVDSTWQQEQQATREQRMQELQMRLQDQRLTAQDRAQLQRELQQNQIQARQDMLRMAASMRPPRQEPQPQIVQTENGPVQVDRAGNARPITMNGEPVRPKGIEKALPTSAAQKLMENQQNLRRAEQALTLIEGNDITDATGNVVAKGDKKATGWHNYLPDAVVQRMDKSGVDTRAAIGDLGSLVIHDRSGAAVTAAEFPRLRPFIPQATDDPGTVKKKLTRFVAEYRNVVQEAGDFYQQSGYKVPTEALRGGAGGASGAWNGPERRGTLSPAEQRELDELKAKLGR